MKDVAYYAVNDRPVKVVEFPDGSSDILVFEWATGAFVPDRSYWEHIHKIDPFKDVDTFTSDEFEKIVAGPRAKALHKHAASAINWEATADPHVFRARADERILTVRDDGPSHVVLFVDNQQLGDLGRWPTTWRRPSGARPHDRNAQQPHVSNSEPGPRVPTLYYTVEGWPLKLVTLANGERLPLMLDATTGGFVPSPEPWTGVLPRGAVEQTREVFDEIVRPLRMKAIVEHLNTPITWERASDPELLYQATHHGHVFTIRLNDFPAEPLFTLLLGNEELADLEDWPASWSRPVDAVP